jgi:hypothetical protein
MMYSLLESYKAYLPVFDKGDPDAVRCYIEVVRAAAKYSASRTERDPNRLYVTDTTACPRQVAYRITQEPATPLSLGRRVMFREAADIEAHATAAAMWSGILEDYQFPIVIDDRDNWGGRGDIYTKDGRIWDVKSMRSKAFTGYFREIPKPEHEVQLSIYHHHYLAKLPPGLLYVDRGGQNPPEEAIAQVRDKAEMDSMMDAVDEVRTRALEGELPDPLSTEVKIKNKRKSTVEVVDGESVLHVHWSGEIIEQPHWKCGSYCPYELCPAKRFYETPLAKTTTKGIEFTSAGKRNVEKVLCFLRENLLG